jgi:hypothetical protein
MRADVSRRTGFLAGLCVSAVMLLVASAPVVAAPVWKLTSVANSSASPGGQIEYQVKVLNASADAANPADPITLNVDMPTALTAADLSESCPEGYIGQSDFICTISPSPGDLESRDAFDFTLTADIDPAAEGILTAKFTLSGGETQGPISTMDPTVVDANPPGYDFSGFDAQAFANPAGATFTRAGGHPHTLVGYVEFARMTRAKDNSLAVPVEAVKDAWVDLPAALVGSPALLEECESSDLAVTAPDSPLAPTPTCPLGSQVGTVRVPYAGAELTAPLPLFNMQPSPGVPARFGFNIVGTVVLLEARLRSESDYGISVGARNVPQALAASGAYFEFWGTPGDAVHDFNRACPGGSPLYEIPLSLVETCESGVSGSPFLRMPTSCTGPLPWSAHSASWENPGAVLKTGAPDLSDPKWKSTSIFSHEEPGFPSSPNDPTTPWGEPQGMTNCASVPVKGEFEAQSTSIDAETASGLEVEVEIPNPGLENPEGIASSDIKAAKLILPEGMTLNPAVAEGLGVCAPAEYESTALSFHPTPGKGCPDNSKIGVLEVETPLLEERIDGDIYVAQQDDPATTAPGAENPFDSLIALYFVFKNPERGILVKLPVKVEPDPKTGQLVVSLDDLPQVPFSSFRARLREGTRSPLVTPPSCGTYETEIELTGWSDPDNPITRTSSFEIVNGIGGGPCPPGGVPPFGPRFEAGSINNNAGSFSPFYMRLTRNDGEQNMTKFSSILPPGVLGSLAGVGKCPDSAIALAKSKTGKQELASPSCPANSEIGRTLAGAGVGSVFANARGKIYLGGPYKGRPLSVIAITPAVSGPFDAGTVVVQLALTLNPKTAEVEVDGSASDPIPHILQGIVLKVRDLRVYVDRPNFIINPTSCDESSAKATLFGSFLDVFDPGDDQAIALSTRYQAANCLNLGFKPRLKLNLKGGTKRGGHPGLRAIYTPRPGDANIEGMVVRLPRSAFLDQAHIRTICTRVQFAADACPKAAQYGYIRAWTPLLEEPLQGPVWLRSSDNKLPDLVFDLHGLVDVEVATRIDSIRGGVRATVTDIPDAPLSKVVLRMQGAKKGLIVNSRNLCARKSRANVATDGHNGKIRDFKPLLRPDCGAKSKRGKRR